MKRLDQLSLHFAANSKTQKTPKRRNPPTSLVWESMRLDEELSETERTKRKAIQEYMSKIEP